MFPDPRRSHGWAYCSDIAADFSDEGPGRLDERIPVAEETKEAAAEFQMEPMVAALHGGEDYELLFTVQLSAHDQVSAMEGVSVIGNITDKKGSALLVGNDGNAIQLQAQGWNAQSE